MKPVIFTHNYWRPESKWRADSFISLHPNKLCRNAFLNFTKRVTLLLYSKRYNVLVRILLELSKVITGKNIKTKDPSSRTSALPDKVKIKEIFLKKGENQMKVIPKSTIWPRRWGYGRFMCWGKHTDSGNQKWTPPQQSRSSLITRFQDQISVALTSYTSNLVYLCWHKCVF